MSNTRTSAREQQYAASNTVIQEIGRLISSRLDIEQILEKALQSITAHLQHTNVALFMIDPMDPQMLVLQVRSGIFAEHEVGHYRQRIGEGIIGLAAQRGESIFLEDVTKEAHYIAIPGAHDILSELAIPIISDEQLLGVLNVESQQPFSSGNRADLNAVAAQLGVTIDNVQRYRGMLLLYEASQRISEAVDVAGVVRAYLEQVAARGRYACNIALYEFNEAGQRAGVQVRGRWTPDTGLQCPLLVRFPYTRDALDAPLDAGETVVMCNVQTDPRASDTLQRIQAQAQRPALVMIPLLVRGRRIGLVILSYHTVHDWLDAELHPYQITAVQLAAAIDSRQQQAQLAQNDQQIAVLEERRRLSADLHDSVTQLVFSISLIAQSLAPAWRRNPAEGEQRTQRLLELSHSALAEMRSLLRELRPAEEGIPARQSSTLYQMHQDGFAAGLRQYAGSINPGSLQIDVDAEECSDLASDTAAVLYRIAQEALNNVIKHAQATHAVVALHREAQAMTLIVRDNGVGFESQPAADEPLGFGLQTMYERAEAGGGSLHIQSTPGQGTMIKVTLPLNHTSMQPET